MDANYTSVKSKSTDVQYIKIRPQHISTQNKEFETHDVYWSEYHPFGDISNLVTNEGWSQIHPSPKTCLFRKILAGDFGYTDGQGMYSAVRSTESIVRQVQATVLLNALNATRYEDVLGDWKYHVKQCGLRALQVAEKYGLCGETEAVRVADQVFVTWQQTLQASLLDFIRNITSCLYSSGLNGRVGFTKYVDWIACLGIVPIIRKEQMQPHLKTFSKDLIKCTHEAVGLTNRLRVADAVVAQGKSVVYSLTNLMHNVAIMDYDRTEIYYNHNKRTLACFDAVTKECGECLVIWPPITTGDGVLFDSPLQRISGEVLTCYTLREHARLCQILNTAPLRILIGRRTEDNTTSGKTVDRILGENDTTRAGSAASRLVKLIINMKNMRHVGDITETVRSYLEESGSHILDGMASVDTSQPGFGSTSTSMQTGLGPGTNQMQSAFKTSVVNSINGMLEGYVNNLFKTIEHLKDVNSNLNERLSKKEGELKQLQEKNVCGNTQGNVKSSETYPCVSHEIIDVSGRMGEESYVANSFQSRYIPPYNDDLERLSGLWKQELVRCFKLNRINNNQGQEVSVSYSNASILLLIAPYFSSVLRANFGFLVTQTDVNRSEEELCQNLFKKTRMEAYLTQIKILYKTEVRANVIKLYQRPRDVYKKPRLERRGMLKNPTEECNEHSINAKQFNVGNQNNVTHFMNSANESYTDGHYVRRPNTKRSWMQRNYRRSLSASGKKFKFKRHY
ncbi:virion protein [Cercopithecine alphaherpesvirus 9]|uniref:Virion protein n=1 Tax=Cercopithecine herpesvirus 9 (strain DHV) TaxID=36348 RepID=Q9E1W6_CHV9D|nr:capsid portal protein [Cercopithecine alphaherpesvirus 9]AAG27229.1 virion protein [Cercopithecine alphaherpesvirus 9]